MRLSQAANIAPRVLLQADLDDVLSVQGEVMANGDSASRPEGQILAGAVILHEILGNIVGLKERTNSEISNGEPSNLPCH